MRSRREQHHLCVRPRVHAEREEEERGVIARYTWREEKERKRERETEREETKESRRGLDLDETETSKADVRTQTDGRRSRNPEWPPRPLSRLLTDKEESAREGERRGEVRETAIGRGKTAKKERK
ncbi:hypothetical protein ALC57_18893 [Trachymyrmex cornetzi]|uniref:Uncharacterized protein n=1 Tax=Trachymyrmex cornetzi TaxID=471704 RepID=A0A195D7U4_9HYME|nr:hypothetical protein ALC57_18893 [Trachymyrmex cornetzi]